MQNNFSVSRWILTTMLFASTAFAETNNVSSKVKIEGPSDESLNRFVVSYRMGLNISARFKNLGGFTALSNPGTATPGTDHTYDDGYNMVDSSGNAGNLTWFWGYDSASQLPGNDTIVMSSSSSPANVQSKETDEDPQHGMEFTYQREFGRSEKFRWGVETAFGFTDVTISDNRRLSGNVDQINDAYDLDGTIPPAPPYQGPFLPTGSDPLISDIPVRNLATFRGAAMVAGPREFDSQIYGFRLGPYLEYPMGERFSFSLSGGLALLYVSSDFKFRETVTIPTGLEIHSGSGSHSELMPGGYIGGTLQYAMCENVDLFAGAQYQTAGTYTHKENGKKAELNMGESIFVTLGVGFSF